MSLVIDVPPGVVALLLAPIDPQQPAGHFDVEDETYQAIDQEMVKLGGLHEARIDWPYIDEAARQYLVTQCKHFRIVAHLQTVWLRTQQWQRWADALSLLAGMVERYWDRAYPKPGPTGLLAKRKQVKALLQRLDEALPALDRRSFNPALQVLAEQALSRLQSSLSAAQLDQPTLDTLHLALGKYAGQAVAPTPDSADGGARSQGGSAFSPSFLSSHNAVPAGNEREQRRAVLNMAELVNQQDVYDPTGYQLRRFGLWAHLHAAPSVTCDRRTELMAVPRDIVVSYEDALVSNTIDPGLLLRIEKSVSAAPYWFRGSFLAASVAARLEMGEVAAGIRQACARFVRRVPALMELCFSDGTAFVDMPTKAWLTGSDGIESSGSPVQEYAGLRDELVTQLNQEGVEVVLLRLQELQAAYRAPRQRCYATVIAADLLEARGLGWLATDLYANVARVMQATQAAQWEPELYQKLARQPVEPTVAITAVKD
ncbi:type VI secretion system protein TssA [Pseudomonas abieticivorans]|uniref:type VI secretion system protein TssA n=1 Tax=Pseudomonas abieticivorans TaxID=2931382 RepID=UPI0020BEA202|nr:type VI secretion system protein TssA [Pseudomonas sp. PIA16]